MKSGPVVGIILDRKLAPGAKKLEDLAPDKAGYYLCDEHLPLAEAFAREWDQDAHFILYHLQDESGNVAFARANKHSSFPQQLLQAGGRIAITCLVFDHDLPKSPAGAKQEWTEEGLSQFVKGLAESDLPSPSCWYTTLHGSRFVYVLEEPVDHLRAEQLSQAIIAQFTAAGLTDVNGVGHMDTGCVDWTRLFRLPRTVREDTGRRYSDDSRFLLLNGGPALDAGTIETGESHSAPDVFADIKPYEGDLPSVDAIDGLSTKLGANGKLYPSEFFQVARKYLAGREAFDVCFNHAPFDEQKFGGRNNAIVKTVGQIVGMTARQEHSSPEGIYALLFGALEQLAVSDTEGTDWHTIAWDIICRMWSNETAQIDAENALKEASILAGKQTFVELLEKVKAERPGDVPKDPEEAAEWFRQRMIASDGRHHHVMRTDGSYNLRPVADSMLVPMIRELRMEDVIETHEMRGKSYQAKSTQSILNDHATPISQICCSARLQTAYIEGPAGHKILNMPVHRLNPKAVPRKSADVDNWLQALFGDKYDLGIMWLSWALEVNAPICALNLCGTPGTGKGMFAQGLAECFESEKLNNGMALGKYNAGLLDSPLVWCDEGVPNIKNDESLPLDQAFRTMVSGGSVTIRSMYQNPFNASIYPRILFTSNNRDILRDLVGRRDLTDDDIQAVEVRLLSIRVTEAARRFLTARGNYKYSDGWIHGKRSSKYILAGHIRWLHENRAEDVYGSGRLLVEGEVDTTLIRSMRLRSDSSQSVVLALLQMIESNNGTRQGIYVDDSRVWVTPAGVSNYINGPLSQIKEEVSYPRAAQILQQFTIAGQKEIEHGIGKVRTKKIKLPGAERARWVEVDLGILFEEALRYGTPCATVEKLLQAQPEGKLKIAAAIAHAGRGD